MTNRNQITLLQISKANELVQVQYSIIIEDSGIAATSLEAIAEAAGIKTNHVHSTIYCAYLLSSGCNQFFNALAASFLFATYYCQQH